MAKQVKPPKASKGNVRDAKTGRFAGSAKAKSSPSTTVTEKRSRAKKSTVCPDCVAKPGLKPGTDTELCPTCNGSGKVKA